MKNKTLILSVFALIAILAVGFASANPLDISFSQNPFPTHSGEQVTLNFYVSNNGNTNISDIKFTLDVNAPLDLRSAAEKTASLQAGETKTLSYNAYVQDDAKDGKEGITIDYKINGTSYSDDFDVQIAPDQVYLEISNVKSNPSSVAPGERITLIMTLQNTAESEIKDITVRLDLTNSPFAPESVTEQAITSLGNQDTEDVQFNLIALSSAVISVYKVPVQITYFDTFGKEYSRQDFVSIEIYEEPILDIEVDKDTLIRGMPSKLDIKVLNKGLGKVSFVEAKLLPGQYTIEGSDSGYIGTIESDDYNSIEFTIIPKQKDTFIQVTLEYRDSNNKKYSEVKVLNVQAHSVQEAQRLGLLPSFPWFLVIIILVIIAVIVFFIVRRRNKKKKLLQQG
jgi:hypothetical protein